MTSSDLAPAGEGPGRTVSHSQARPPTEQRRDPPPRPSLAEKTAAPVLVKLPAPFVVRASQILWILSVVTGGAAVVYMFVIRQAQLPDIVERIRAVDGSRAASTYTFAADIVFWTVFGATVTLIALQIMFLVSFANRRPHTRWWLFGSLIVQTAVYLLAQELVAMGERGVPLQQLLRAELALGLLGLLFGVLPPALRWTARRHDVRHGGTGGATSGGEL